MSFALAFLPASGSFSKTTDTREERLVHVEERTRFSPLLELTGSSRLKDLSLFLSLFSNAEEKRGETSVDGWKKGVGMEDRRSWPTVSGEGSATNGNDMKSSPP